MKIKRIISCIIACALVISLCACGKKSTEKAQVKSPTELQKYYENYFSSKEAGFAGDSVKIAFNGFSLETLTASDKTKKMSFADNKNTYEFYKTSDDKQYVHVIESNETTDKKTDTWYQYIPSKNEGMGESKEQDLFIKDNSSKLTSRKIKGESFKNVKYLKTEKGIDYLSVSVKGNSFDMNDKITSSVNKIGVDSKTHKIVFASGKSSMSSLSGKEGTSKNDIKIKMDFTFSNPKSIKMNIPKKIEKCDAKTFLSLFLKASYLMVNYVNVN